MTTREPCYPLTPKVFPTTTPPAFHQPRSALQCDSKRGQCSILTTEGRYGWRPVACSSGELLSLSQRGLWGSVLLHWRQHPRMKGQQETVPAAGRWQLALYTLQTFLRSSQLEHQIYLESKWKWKKIKMQNLDEENKILALWRCAFLCSLQICLTLKNPHMSRIHCPIKRLMLRFAGHLPLLCRFY